jgi:ABC-type transporter Mla subunit MlaD
VIRTTGQLVAFHGRLEDSVAEALRSLAQLHPEAADALNRLADENTQHREAVVRVYREGVTDAFEVGYLSRPLDEDDYPVVELEGPLGGAVEAALVNEDTLIRFLRDAADDSNQLLPGLPQAFQRLAKRKEKRKAVLESLAQ